jgi:hypothetical protein
MIVNYANNEFTGYELLSFVTAAFGCQVNGNPFKSYHLNNWIRIGKVPDAYGGYRILSVEKMEGLHSGKVLALSELTRDVLIDIQRHPLQVKNPPIPVRKPRKQRTALYYELLERVGKQYTRKTKKVATISNQWKMIGIKRNQLIN